MTRPVVYDFASPAPFLDALVQYYQQSDQAFSIRSRIRCNPGCSPAYVSLLIKGKRRLSRDYLPIVADVFRLTNAEVEYVDSLISLRTTGTQIGRPLGTRNSGRTPRNQILSDWVNIYVKDCINLKLFDSKPDVIFRLLGGIAPRRRIEKAIGFLYREGFWRRTLNGKTVPDDSAVITTSGVPSAKIRQFHKAALEIAKKGLDRFPPGRRRAYATVISVSREGFDELQSLVDRFHKDLQEFIDRNPDGDDKLCQVTIHLTPIGGQHDQVD